MLCAPGLGAGRVMPGSATAGGWMTPPERERLSLGELDPSPGSGGFGALGGAGAGLSLWPFGAACVWADASEKRLPKASDTIPMTIATRRRGAKLVTSCFVLMTQATMAWNRLFPLPRRGHPSSWSESRLALPPAAVVSIETVRSVAKRWR